MRLSLVSLLAVGLLTGCQSEAEEVAETVVQTYEVRGIYVGPQYDGAAAVVDHEPIPDYMESMRMPFRAEDPSELAGLTAGDKIAFDLYLTGVTSYIANVEVLPDTTALDLPHLTPDADLATGREAGLYATPPPDSLVADSSRAPTP